MKTKKKYEDGGSTGGGRSVVKETVSRSNKMYDLAGKKKTVSKNGEVVKTKIKRTITPTSTGKPSTTVSVIKGSGPDAPTKSRKGIIPVKAKTGGMVNSNAKVAASKKATGKVGGISTAPKTATPKMKMGGSTKKKSC